MVPSAPVPVVPAPAPSVLVPVTPVVPAAVEPVLIVAAEVMSPRGPTDVFGSLYHAEPVDDPLSLAKGKRKRSYEDDEEAAVRAGPSRARAWWDTMYDSPESQRDPRGSAFQFEEEAVAEEVDDADDCVELVNIESSTEVIDLTSESDADWDPSEGSSIPPDF